MAESAPTTAPRPRTRGFHGAVDPRTLFLYVIVLNVLLMGAGSTPLVLGCLGVVVVSLALSTRPKTWIGWLVFVMLWVFCCFALPVLWHTAVSAFLVFIAFWMFRFAGVVGSAVVAIKVIDVTRSVHLIWVQVLSRGQDEAPPGWMLGGASSFVDPKWC